MKPKQPCIKNNGTYTFLSRTHLQHPLILAEKERHTLSLPLEKKNQLFFAHFLRLCVPKSPDEPHNFMPCYENRKLNHPSHHLEVLLQDRATPFYNVSPMTLKTEFETMKAQNLGALIFLNALFNLPFRDTDLYLVQSSSTKKYYFTQKISAFQFNALMQEYSLTPIKRSNLEQKISRIMANFVSPEHRLWWEKSGLLPIAENKSDLPQIPYQEVLLDEIFLTIFRLSLTPMEIFQRMLDHVYMPQQSVIKLSQMLQETLEQFQREYQEATFRQMNESLSNDLMRAFYFNYLDEIHQFSLFPIGPLRENLHPLDFQKIECMYLKNGQDIGQIMGCLFFPQSMIVERFKHVINIPLHFFLSALSKREHLFWSNLKYLVSLIFESAFATNININFDERLKCVLVKSIEFRYLEVTKMILFHLNFDIYSTFSEYIIEKEIATHVGHPEWEGWNLLQIAQAVSNHEIANCLLIYPPSKNVLEKPPISEEELLPGSTNSTPTFFR